MRNWGFTALACLALLIGASRADITHDGFSPRTNDDLTSLIRLFDAAAKKGRACDSAKKIPEEKCMRRDCAQGQALAAEIFDMMTILNSLRRAQGAAVKDARDHHDALMSEARRKGRQVYEIEKALYWQAKFIFVAKMLLGLADGFEYLQSLPEVIDKGIEAAFGVQAKTSDLLHLADIVDGAGDQLMNTADLALNVVSWFKEKEIKVPDWLDSILTLRQAATDIKDLSKGLHEASELLVEAQSLREVAATASNPVKQQLRKKAAALQGQAKDKARGAAAAFGQLLAKALLVVADAVKEEREKEIEQIMSSEDAEIKAIQTAWNIAAYRDLRLQAIEAALVAAADAQKALSSCLAECSPATVPAADHPVIPEFYDPDGKYSYGKAGTFLNKLLAERSKKLKSVYDGFWPLIARTQTPRALVSTSHPGRYISPGQHFRLDYAVAQCDDDAAFEAGGKSVSLNGSTGGSLILDAPREEGPILLKLKRSKNPAAGGTGGSDMEEEELWSILLELEVSASEGTIRDCGYVDCDCDAVDFGILTGDYQEDCRKRQDELIAQCQAQGFISGVCHETASGPDAWPF